MRKKFYTCTFVLLILLICSILKQQNNVAHADTTATAGTVVVATTNTTQTTTSSTDAANEAALKQQIDDRNQNIAQLQQEIATYTALADKTSAEANTLQKSIKSLEVTRKKLDLSIDLAKKKIAATTQDIKTLGNDISSKQSNILDNQKALGQLINSMAQNEQISIVGTVLSKGSLSDALQVIDQISTVTSSLKKSTDDLSQAKFSLETAKTQNEVKKNDLVKLSGSLLDQQKLVNITQQQKNQLLTDTKSKESNYQKIVADKVAKEAALEKDVYDFEAKLKYKIDPNTLPSAGSAPFSWPTDNVKINQFFGKTVGASRLYASGSHNGVDFKASLGTPVHAVLSGVVLGTGDTDLTCPRASFGRWILIKNDDGLAEIFGHLSLIKVTSGQRVSTGDIIAYSGNTGYSTGPHLHISVYAANSVNIQTRPSAACSGKTYTMPIAPVNGYLDPMLYFPSYNG